MRKRRSYYRFRLSSITRKLQSVFQKTKMINMIIVVGFLLLITFFTINIRKKLYSPLYTVNKVIYTKDSTTSYFDSSLYNDITLTYLCRSYSDIKIFGDHSLYKKDLKEKYSFIDDIVIESFADNTLGLHITFVKPALRFLYKDKLYGGYTDTLIPLKTEDTLGYGLPLVLLPVYLQDTSASISGLLYNLDINKMLYDVLLLKTIPISGDITYIPGGDKYIYGNDSLRIYFNAKKNIFSQIMLFSTLMTQYRGFNKLRQIDVGSLDNPIIK